MARWLIHTSAWARREIPAIKAELKKRIGTDGELVLSPAVLLEVLQGPQGEAVAEVKEELTDAMDVLAADAETFDLAAQAMVKLAAFQPQAHRVPIPDLITAALAHQHDLPVLHCDKDFAKLAKHSGLKVNDQIPVPPSAGAHPAAKQRALRKQLAQVLQAVPPADAEAFLEQTIKAAQKL